MGIYIAQVSGVSVATGVAAFSQASLYAKIKLVTAALWAQAKAWAATPMGAVTLTVGSIMAVTGIVDALTTSFDEQTEVVTDLSEKISELNSEYEALLNKTNRTDEDEKKLKLLEAELKVRKDILAVEAEKRYDKYQREQKALSTSGLGVLTGQTTLLDSANVIRYTDKIKELENEKLSLDSTDKNYIETVDELNAKIDKFKSNRANSLEGVIEERDILQDVLDYGGNLEPTDQARLDFLNNLILVCGDSSDSLDALIKTEKEAMGATSSLADSFKKLSSVKDSISSLNSAYKELAEDGGVSFDTLSKIQESFAKVDGIDKYINALANAKGNTQETTQILSDLTFASINAKYSTEQLANADANLIAKMLEENGVLNANTVATQAVSAAKIAVATSAVVAGGNISNLISALNGESQASGVAKQQLANLTAQQIIFNNTGLSVADKISNLAALAQAAYGTAGAYGALNAAMAGGLGVNTSNATPEAKAKYEKFMQNKLQRQWADMAGTISTPNVSYGGGTSKGGGGSGNSKETEEYIADIDKLYEANKRLADIKEKIERIDTQSNLTDDPKQKIAYLNQIVDLYKDEQKALSEINNLRREEIKSNIAKMQEKGFDVFYDEANNDLLVKNKAHINDLGKASGLTQEKINELRKEYEELIKTTEDLNDANKDGSKQWWELQEKLKGVKKQYDEVLSSMKDTYKSTVDAILKVIDKEQEALKKQEDALKKRQSDMETAVSTVTNFIDKQIDALQKENDELDRQVQTQKELEALEKAKQQDIHRIYKEGEGLIWGADQDAVNEAQQAHDKGERDRTLEDKIKALEEYKQLWQDVVDGYQRGIDEQITAEKFGADWQTMILAQKTTKIHEYAYEYSYVSSQLNENTAGSVAFQIKQLDDLSDKWGKAYDEIEASLDDYTIDLTTLQEFEAANYSQRLEILKTFVQESISELQRLKAAQAAAEAAVTNGSYKYPTSGGGSSSGYPTHDFSSDTIDYSEKMANSKDAAEFEHWAGFRDKKMEAQGINPSDNGWKTNEEIYNEWKGNKGFSSGGVVDFTGMAMMHGKSAAEMVVNNADVGKLYDYIHETPSLVNEFVKQVSFDNFASSVNFIKPEARQKPSVTFNGDIVLQGVQDTNKLARELKMEIRSIMGQVFYEN